MDRDGFNNIKKTMEDELAEDRIKIKARLEKETVNDAPFMGDTAKEDADREAKRQEEQIKTEMAEHEAKRKELHFKEMGESYEEVKARLEREDAAQAQQQQATAQKEKEQQQQKEKEEKEKQAQQVAEKAKEDNAEIKKQNMKQEFARVNPNRSVTNDNVPTDATQAKEELTREQKMAEYDKRMREHFDKSSGREQDNDQGY